MVLRFAKQKILTMHKKYWLLVGILGGAIILGILIYAGVKIVPSLMAQRKFSELKTNLLSDDNGGATPIETIKLFKSALEQGDLQKASKYFVYEEQAGILEDLNKLVAKGEKTVLLDYLSQIIDDKNPKREYITDSPDMVTINILSDKPNFREFSVELRRPGNDITGTYKTWKIKSM